MGSAIFGHCGPMSLLYPFDLSLKNWLYVKWVALKLCFFGQQVLLCSTRFQPQDCRSLLNLVLLDATGLSPAFPSTRQSMILYSLLKSTLRRLSLVQYSSCFPEPMGNSVAIEEDRSIAAGRDLDTTLSFSVCSCILASSITSFLSLTFVSCHAGMLSKLEASE